MNLQEHADKIKAAFEAAERDGFVLSFEWEHSDYEYELNEVSLDINEYAWFELNGKRMRKVSDWAVLRKESF